MKFRAGWLCLGFFLVALVTYLSLKTGPHHLSGSESEDKLEHLAALMVPTLWFGQLYTSPRGRRNVILSLLSLGVFLEMAQRQVGGYAGIEWGDIAANCAGVVLGWVLLRTGMGSVLARFDRWLRAGHGAG